MVVQVVGLPDVVEADYEYNNAYAAGTYNAHAVLRYDEANLEVAAPIDCQWKINKRRVDISDVCWNYNGAFSYNGKEQGIYLVNVPEGLSVEYTDNVKIDSGKYVASATLIPNDSFNYETPEINGCTWAINKADLPLNEVVWTDCSEFVYDGREKKVEIISDPGDAIEVDYEDNTAVNAGRYFSKAIFSPVDPANFKAPGPVGYSWTIAKARHDMSEVVWNYENEFTYDGSSKSVKLLNVPEGIIVKYKDERQTEAGTYLAVAQFEVQNATNYEENIPDMTLEWSIRKASFNMSKVRWAGEKGIMYDGKEKTVTLEGLPDGLVPVYTENKAIDAGEYTAKADFEYDRRNYEMSEVAPYRWTIERSPVDVSGVVWDYEKSFVYDGSEKTVAVTGLPEGTRAVYSNTTAIAAGTYVAGVEIVPEDTENCLKNRIGNLTWRIERGNYDMSHAHWDYDKPFTYDGSEHRVIIKGLPEGVIPSYHGNSATDVGRYKARVTFTIADGHNFNVPEFDALEWSIDKADYDMSGTSWNYSGEFTYSGRMYEVSLRGLPDGVRAVYAGNAAAETGSYEATADLIPYDSDNYNKPIVESCKWQIIKADYEMSAVKWDYNAAKIYNGREQSVMLEHLPNGVSASYWGNEAVDVGSYTAKASLTVADPVNFNVPSVNSCDWEICRAEYDMRSVTWDYIPGKFTFDGEQKSVRLVNLPHGVKASYKGNTATYAGSYTAEAEFTTEDDNFNPPPAVSLNWEIEKADYDMSRVAWDYTDSFTYDGSAKRVMLIGLPERISVEYENNTATDAGNYQAVARFTSETSDYNVPEGMSCMWAIDKADVDIRRVRWDYSQSFIYDGTVRTVSLEGLPELLTASYEGNESEKAGKYIAHAVLSPVMPENYNQPSVTDCSWEIRKASYDMSSVRWEGDMEFLYDGTAKSVKLEGLPEGVEPIYHNNTAVEAGEYMATVDFAYDKDNYNKPVMGGTKWSIEKASYDMSAVSWINVNGTVYDGTVKSVELTGLPAGVTPVYSGNEAVDAGSYEASVTFEYDRVNYYRPVFGGCSWSIEPADIDVDITAIRWNYTTPFVYDGTLKSVGIAEKSGDTGLFSRLRGKKPDLGLVGVPEGFDVVYDHNSAVDAGVYYASAKLISSDNSDNYREFELPKFKWEILKARIDMSNVRWNYYKAFVYDGEEKTVELTGLPDTVKVSYTDNTGVDSGEHEALAVFEVVDPDNYETPEPVSGCWWQIDKAVYDMSEVRWTYDDDIVYNGKEKIVRVVGLPEGVKIEAYIGNKAIEAGNYTAGAVLKYRNKENYEEPMIPALKWRIQKRKINTDDVAWNYDDSTLFVFDDKPKEVRLVGVPKDIDVVYIDNSKINAGTYTARARLVYDTRNCEAEDVPDLRWKIDKAVYDTSEVRWTYTEPFRYDGSEKSIYLRDVPNSISVRYRDNKASAIGTYTAKAYLTYDRDNYEAPDIQTTIDWAIVGKEVE